MAFPVVGARALTEVEGATSHLVNLPTGIVSGHLLIVVIGFNRNPVTITWPAGWTNIEEANWASNVLYSARYRVADGTEGATITITSGSAEDSAAVAWRITGHSSSTNPPAKSTANGATDSTTMDPAAVTPAGGAKDYLVLATAAYGRVTAQVISSYPASYSNGQNP